MQAQFASVVVAFAVTSTLADYSISQAEIKFTLEELQGNTPNEDDKNMYMETFAGQGNCGITGMIPEKPRSLSFCHKFNDQACCAPAMDDENNEFFNLLTGLGLSCRLRGDIREDPIAKWYCLNCDPEQASYVRPVAFLDVCDGGCPTGDRTATILVDKKWAEDGFGIDPLLDGPQSRFQQCGLKKSSPCLDINEDPIPDRDRYTCGDDLVIPNNAYRMENEDGTIDTTMSIEAFMNSDSMGPPVLDEMYGFFLVDGVCKEEDLVAAYADISKDEAQRMRCLRTQDQLIKTKYDFTNGTVVVKATFRDFFCNNGFGEGPDWDDGDPGAHNVEDCTSVRADGVDPDTPEDKCKDPKTRAEYPCCCGAWNAERAFNAASVVAPGNLFAALALLMAAFAI
jgi:hypothetical protein